MAWGISRGILGGLVAMLVAAPASLAQTGAPAAAPHPAAKAVVAAAHPAARQTAKHPAVKPAAAKPGPARRAKAAAVAKAKASRPAGKLAAAPHRHEPAKATAATHKPAPATRVAAARPAAPSYTVTTTRDGVTTTTTRRVRLSQTPHPAATAGAPPKPRPTVVAALPVSTARPTMVAALPVSLTRPATPAAAHATDPAAGPAPLQPAVAAPATSPDPKAAAAFVANFLNQAFHVARLDGATSLQRRAQLADLFARKLDMRRIAGDTAADKLAGASSDVQQRFRTILVSYLVETYYPQLELASDPSVTVEATPAPPLADGTAVVWTTFTKDGWGAESVKWLLEPGADGYRIVDIFCAGASLVQMERDTFRSVMRNGGLPELMAKLDARTRELASAATE